MDSSWRRLFSVIRTCRKTIRRGLKGIRRRAYSIGTYLKLKRTRARDDEELESAEIFDDSQQEAIVCNEPFGMSMTKMNYDCTTVETVAEEQLVKNKKIAKRMRRRKGKSALNTLTKNTVEDVLLADESSRVTEKLVDSAVITSGPATSSANLGNQKKLCKDRRPELKQNSKSAMDRVTADLSPRRMDKRDKTQATNTGANSENRPVAGDVENVVTPESSDTKTAKSVVVKSVVQQEFDRDAGDKIIRRLAKEASDKYERLHNLDDIISALTADDEHSCIRTRHERFVTCVTIITLDGSSKSRTEAGKMFAELLSKKVLSVNAITRGIDEVLKDFNDYSMDYPNFFSAVAAIVAPLLISKTASFEYINLKYACSSIRPHNSGLFFVEVLRTVLRSEKDDRNAVDFSGTLRTFKKWSSQSKHVLLDVFIVGKEINKFIKNDRVGVLILAMAMYDMTKMMNDEKSLNDITHKWICRHIDAEVTKKPRFVRTLSMAVVIACTNRLKIQPNEDLIDRGRGELLNRYVRHEFPATETRSREVECVEGCVIISTAIGDHENYGGMSFKAFFELYRDGVICTKSLKAWGNKGKSPIRTATVEVLTSFFNGIDSWKAIKIST